MKRNLLKQKRWGFFIVILGGALFYCYSTASFVAKSEENQEGLKQTATDQSKLQNKVETFVLKTSLLKSQSSSPLDSVSNSSQKSQNEKLQLANVPTAKSNIPTNIVTKQENVSSTAKTQTVLRPESTSPDSESTPKSDSSKTDKPESSKIDSSQATFSNVEKKEKPTSDPFVDSAEKELFQIMADAYVYAFPLVLMNEIEKEMTDSIFFAPVNQMAYIPTLPSPSFKMTECPNVDGLTSIAWLDLSQGPQVICLPIVSNQQFIMELLDAWTNVIDTFSNQQLDQFPVREMENRQVRCFILAKSDFNEKEIDGIPVIKSSTEMIWLINRVLLGTPRISRESSIAAASRILYEFEVISLNVFLKEFKKVAEQKTKSSLSFHFDSIDENLMTTAQPNPKFAKALSFFSEQAEHLITDSTKVSKVSKAEPSRDNQTILTDFSLKDNSEKESQEIQESQTAQSVKSPRNKQSNQNSQTLDNSQITDNIQTDQTAQNIQNTVQPQANQFQQTNQINQNKHNSQNSETVQNTQNHKTNKNAHNLNLSQNAQNLEPAQNTKLTDNAESTQKTQTTDNVDISRRLQTSHSLQTIHPERLEPETSLNAKSKENEANTVSSPKQSSDQVLSLEPEMLKEESIEFNFESESDKPETLSESSEIQSSEAQNQSAQIGNESQKTVDLIENNNEQTIQDDLNSDDETVIESEELNELDQPENPEMNSSKFQYPLQPKAVKRNLFSYKKRSLKRQAHFYYNVSSRADEKIQNSPEVVSETISASETVTDSTQKPLEPSADSSQESPKQSSDEKTPLLDRLETKVDQMTETIEKEGQKEGNRFEKLIENAGKTADRIGDDLYEMSDHLYDRTKNFAEEGMKFSKDSIDYFDRKAKRDYRRLAQKIGMLLDAEKWVEHPIHRVHKMSTTDFFVEFAELLKKNPPLATDQEMLSKLAKIGIIPGESFDPQKLDAKAQQVLRYVVPYAQGKIREAALYGTCRKNLENHWVVFTDLGQYGTDYMHRAIIASEFIGADSAPFVLYPYTMVDQDGNFLSGEKDYVIHFPAGQTPPVHVLWSLTMYDENHYLVPNRLKRYSIRSNEPLIYNEDGSLDIYIQHKEPLENLSNWLPAPQGDFMLMFRLYLPKEDALDGRWQIVPVQMKKDETIKNNK